MQNIYDTTFRDSLYSQNTNELNEQTPNKIKDAKIFPRNHRLLLDATVELAVPENSMQYLDRCKDIIVKRDL